MELLSSSSDSCTCPTEGLPEGFTPLWAQVRALLGSPAEAEVVRRVIGEDLISTTECLATELSGVLAILSDVRELSPAPAPASTAPPAAHSLGLLPPLPVRELQAKLGMLLHQVSLPPDATTIRERELIAFVTTATSAPPTPGAAQGEAAALQATIGPSSTQRPVASADSALLRGRPTSGTARSSVSPGSSPAPPMLRPFSPVWSSVSVSSSLSLPTPTSASTVRRCAGKLNVVDIDDVLRE
eukprot:RCo045863